MLAILLSGCVERRAGLPARSPDEDKARINRALPAKLSDREGWTDDIYSAFAQLGIEPTAPNTCAVAAVIAQESSFAVNPFIPNLGAIASREIDRRAEHVYIPLSVVHGVLGWQSPDGRSWSERIDAARTEKDLSDVYEAFIAGVPMGRTLFENRNPVRTRGPMQVNVAFAEQFAETHQYPYPLSGTLGDELFTRRGSIYFGVAHLLAYRAPYDSYLYRFADYNAGQFSSRNAAFQRAVAIASHRPLTADGALLPHDASNGDTELLIRTLSSRLSVSETDIHAALGKGRTEDFEGTALYRRTFSLAEEAGGQSLPRAVVPSIELTGPKLHRHLTTAWYAQRVDDRFQRCLQTNH
ncbi:MAG TPA: DUF1615 domain-containing protein [Steroidobacteraceae bacterium]|jgi:hypothetical protein|nr:DUF1615 domain-containing protein [Steroidobacteraceae bacterium]